MYQTLLQANLKKDVEKIHTVIRLLDNVRGAWQVVVRGEAAAPVAALAGGRAA
jgi:flagellin-specific chaperone FliS